MEIVIENANNKAPRACEITNGRISMERSRVSSKKSFSFELPPSLASTFLISFLSHLSQCCLNDRKTFPKLFSPMAKKIRFCC